MIEKTKGKIVTILDKDYAVGDYVITNSNYSYPGNICIITAITSESEFDSTLTVQSISGDKSSEIWNVSPYEINEASLLTVMHKKTKRFVKSFVKDEITETVYHLETAKPVSDNARNKYEVISDVLPPMQKVITIDGPAGAGKGTMAKLLSQQLKNSYLCVDTGAFYRALAVALLKRCGGSIPHEWIKDIRDMQISAAYDKGRHLQIMFVNNVELTEDELRNGQISQIASKISAEPEVRRVVNKAIREYAKGRRVIIEGRDTGSVIMPDAKVKFYLTADVETRAKRRCQQTNNDNYEAVLAEIRERDNRDSTRAADPLTIPENAIYIDSSDLTIQQTADVMKNIAENLLKTA